jgi:hypothetical protein
MTKPGGDDEQPIEEKDLADRDGASLKDTAGKPVGEAVGFDRVLLAEAGRGAARAEQGHDDNDAVAGATAATILCAAAACEARLSEYVTRQESLKTLPRHFIECIRDERDALKQWRLLVRRRVPGFELGANREYDALGCLFELRNVVAHRSARATEVGTRPPDIQDCIRQRIIPVRRTAAPMDWTSTVYVPEVARWAYDTARDWLAIADRCGIVI